MSNMTSDIVNMLINKNFSGACRQVLPYRKVSLYACSHAYECANIDILSYPSLSKELKAQE